MPHDCRFFRDGKKVNEIVGGDINALKSEVAKATLPALVTALRLDALVSTIVSQPQQSAVLAAVLAYLAIPWQRFAAA